MLSARYRENRFRRMRMRTIPDMHRRYFYKVVVTYAYVIFPWVYLDNGWVLNILRNSPAVPYRGLLFYSFTIGFFVGVALPYLYILAAIASGAAAFPLESFFIAAVVTSIVGRYASSSMSGRWATLSIAACEIVDERFSTSRKCSVHRSRMRLGVFRHLRSMSMKIHRFESVTYPTSPF